MTVEVFYDDDADLSVIQGRKVAVIGYGSQGHAHALSLRDSGVDVRVGLPEGSKSRPKAEEQGLRVVTPAEAAAEADVIMMLAPDTAQRSIYAESIAPVADRGQGAVLRARAEHPVRADHPAVRRGRRDGRAEGPGSPGPPPVRRRQGRAVPGRRRAGRRPAARCALALSYAKAIGGTRAGVIRTTFTEETETDLFGEQAVLCGGASALVQTGFEVLTEAGYAPEVAYFECLHELKLIVDLMYEGGIARMRYSRLRHRRVRRLLARPARHRRAGQGRDAHASWPRSSPASSPASGSPRTTPAGRTSPKWREQGAHHPIEETGAQAARHDELGGPPDHRDRLSVRRRETAAPRR